MTQTKAYRPTRPDIEWIAGRRVQPDEPLLLTEAEAEFDLARGNIEPVPAAELPAEAPRKARKD